MTKVLVLGHGGHGKDTFAEAFAHTALMTYCSSSWFCAEHVIYPALKHRYSSVQECFDDRKDNRDLWYRRIREYNKPDGTRLAREILSKYDMYIGMRSLAEFYAFTDKPLFDIIFWIDARYRVPLEKSMDIEYRERLMNFVDNSDRTELELIEEAKKLGTMVRERSPLLKWVG